MGGIISDIFTLPGIVILIGIGFLLFLYFMLAIVFNSTNTTTQTEAIRFADAMSTFVESNSGFTDAGADSFPEFVADYVSARPPEMPMYVTLEILAAPNDKQPLRGSGFWILNKSYKGRIENTRADIAQRVRNALESSDGSHPPVVTLTTGRDPYSNNYTLQENTCFRITIRPMYRRLTVYNTIFSSDKGVNANVSDPFQNSNLNYSTSFRPDFGGKDSIFLKPDNLLGLGKVSIYWGRPIQTVGQVGNYIKETQH